MITPSTNATTINFETGKTYFCRSACDHNCIFTYTVVRRTAKSVWLKEEGRHYRKLAPKRRTVKMDGNTEYVLPDGSYSMCSFLSATKVY